MSAKRYRHTDVPSIFQGDVPDGEEIDFVTGLQCDCDFHHVMNGAYKHKAEQDGFWVWLTREHHDHLHNTPEGIAYQKSLKAKCQEYYERHHTREQWMKRYKKNYL